MPHVVIASDSRCCKSVVGHNVFVRASCVSPIARLGKTNMFQTHLLIVLPFIVVRILPPSGAILRLSDTFRGQDTPMARIIVVFERMFSCSFSDPHAAHATGVSQKPIRIIENRPPEIRPITAPMS